MSLPFIFRKHFHVLEDDINYSLLIPCLSKAREMYKILLRKNQQYVEIEDFLIELRAAKIDQNILKYILQNEGRSKMDFIDYLTFFPLFVYTHNVIIDNLLYTEKTWILNLHNQSPLENSEFLIYIFVFILYYNII